MKLGVANGREVIDCDLSDTLDIQPRYSDCVAIFLAGHESADNVAQTWLDHMSEGD